MSTVAAVYTVAPNERSPEDILNVLKTDEDAKEQNRSRPRPENKRVWASLEKEPEVVISEMFAEAESGEIRSTNASG